DPPEPLPRGPHDPVEDLLRRRARRGVPGLLARPGDVAVALARGEGILEPFEGGIHVRRRVAALAQREGGRADAVRRDDRHLGILARVGPTGVLEEVLDLVDVVAEAALAGSGERHAHPAMLPTRRAAIATR